jgi:outer membrane protein assembly factor BamB
MVAFWLVAVALFATVNAQWLMDRGFPNRTAFSADLQALASCSVVWSTVHDPAEQVGPAVAFGDAIYVQLVGPDSSHAYLARFSATTGDMLWKQPIPGFSPEVVAFGRGSALSLDGSRVFLPSDPLTALDTATGAVAWEHNLLPQGPPNSVMSFVATDGSQRVLINVDKTWTVLSDGATPSVAWSWVDTSNCAGGQCGVFPNLPAFARAASGRPAIVLVLTQVTVLYPDGSHTPMKLVALNADDGSLLWSRGVSNWVNAGSSQVIVTPFGPPVVDDGRGTVDVSVLLYSTAGGPNPLPGFMPYDVRFNLSDGSIIFNISTTAYGCDQLALYPGAGAPRGVDADGIVQLSPTGVKWAVNTSYNNAMSQVVAGTASVLLGHTRDDHDCVLNMVRPPGDKTPVVTNVSLASTFGPLHFAGGLASVARDAVPTSAGWWVACGNAHGVVAEHGVRACS